MRTKKFSVEEPMNIHLYVGRLMAPDEVTAALSDRSKEERERIGRRWMFCCDVAPEMFEQLLLQRQDDIAFRITGFGSSLGGAYAVLTHEVEGHQHRYLLPLYDQEVQQAIVGAAREPHGFLMGNDSQIESVILYGAPHIGQSLLGLPGLTRQLSKESLAIVIPELPEVIRAMTEVDRIPPLKNEAIRSVSVTVVMPTYSFLQVDDELPTKLEKVPG